MNQYSCQNCKREHNAHLCVYCAIRLSEYDKEFLEVVGCASHSDFQSERETVLGEIGNTRCKNCDIDWQECNCPLRWKKELRRAGEQV